MNPSPSWHLNLIGTPTLVSHDGGQRPLEGKPLAILAYLALESNATRSRLAGLLWPDRVESAARNNLVQLLRRMRSTFKDALVTEQEHLSLAPHVHVDARDEWHEGQDEELLVGVQFDELDLADWLTVQRERFDVRRARSLARSATLAEERGHLEEATRLATRVLELDGLSEDAHRRVMRLLYLRGDFEEALARYRHLRHVLSEELDTEPMPETLDLVRLIERGEARPSIPTPRVNVPPPRTTELVGRSRELALMEQAWQAGQFIILTGLPGMGKSRLATHFTTAKGTVLPFEGRPGDSLVPYTAVVRNLRKALSRTTTELPLDVRRTLSFLLPELAPPNELPAATASPHLHDAIRFAFALGLEIVRAFLFDDIQFVDEASIEVGFHLIDEAFPMGRPGGLPHFVAVHREGELPPATRAIFERLVNVGRAVWIHVPPLDEEETKALLATLNVPDSVAAGLASASNGHPLFLLEGAHALQREGTLGHDGTIPLKLGQLLGDRLGRLPKVALQVARACAVLRRDFTPELVASVLSAPVLHVANAWSELEGASILTGERFHHDLVAEAVLSGMPASVRRLLHRGAARTLTEEDAPPARIAWHWREGGQDLEAAPWLLRAGEAARASLRFREAAEHFEAAARVFEANEDPRAFQAWLRRAQELGMTDDAEARQEAVNDLLERAGTSAEVAQGWQLQGELYVATGEGRRAENAVRRGLAALGEHDALTLRANLLADLGTALWVQENLRDAEGALRESITLLEPLGDGPDLASNLSSLAVILDHQDRHGEARGVHERACALLEQLGEFGHLAVALRNLSVCLSELGDARGALRALRRVQKLREGGSSEDAALTLVLGLTHADLGEYEQAVTYLERVVTLEHDPTGWLRAYTSGCLGEVLVTLGEFEQAEALLTAACEADVPGAYRVRLVAALARLAFERGEDMTPHLERANELLGCAPRPFALGRVRLVEALREDAREAERAAREALDVARAHELGGVELSAHARLAAVHLRLGNVREAACHAEEAARRLEALEPSDVTRGEVLVTLHDARVALGDPDAALASRLAKEWLDGITAHVPVPSRSSFRSNPRVNRAIVRLAGEVVTREP